MPEENQLLWGYPSVFRRRFYANRSPDFCAVSNMTYLCNLLLRFTFLFSFHIHWTVERDVAGPTKHCAMNPYYRRVLLQWKITPSAVMDNSVAQKCTQHVVYRFSFTPSSSKLYLNIQFQPCRKLGCITNISHVPLFR